MAIRSGIRERRRSFVVFSDATTETDPTITPSDLSSSVSTEPSLRTKNTSGWNSIASAEPSTSSRHFTKSSKELHELKASLPVKESEEPMGKGSFRYTQSLIPTSIFMKHLSFAKEEEVVLTQLRNDISVANFASFKDDPFTRDPDVASKKSIYGSMHEHSLQAGPFEPGSVNISQIDISSCITLDEVMDNPFKTFTEKVIKCYNVAPPVLTAVNNNFVLNTVIEDFDTRKVASFETICTLNEAEKFTVAVKYPYLYCVGLGAVLVLRNPTFQTSLHGKHYCVHLKSLHDVDFIGCKGPDVESKSKYSAGRSSSRSKSGCSTITEEDDDSVSTFTLDLNVLRNAHFPDELAVRDAWRDWGDTFAIGRMHSSALAAYTVAQRFDKDNFEIKFTRGASLINLGFFGEALKDINSIISMDPLNTGLILRKVHCLWGLGDFKEAHQYLSNCLEALTTPPAPGVSMDDDITRKNIFVRKILAKTEKILKQSESADLYDIEMYFKNDTQTFSNEPEYYVPIKMICKPGLSDRSSSSLIERTAITNRPVAAGSIVAVTRAFGVVFQDVEEIEGTHGGSSDELMNLIMQKVVIENPSEYEIYHLRDADSSEANSSSVSIDQVRKFCTKYGYSSDRSNSVNFARDPPHTKRSPNFAMSPVQPVIKGVWTFPTHITHACVGGNVLYYICGNLMFIRAICDIPEGEELLMAHVDPTKSYEERREFMEAKGLRCSCSLCLFEKSESELLKIKRVNILGDMNFRSLNWGDSPESTHHEIKRMKIRLDDLEVLRSAYPKLNFPVVEPLYLFGLFFMKIDNFEEAIASFEKCYFIVENTSLVFLLVDLSFLLAYCYMAKRKNPSRNRAKKWYDAFKGYTALSYGSISPTKNKFKVQYEFLRRKTIAT